MKELASFKLYSVTAFCALLLVAQPANIIYYEKKIEIESWELLTDEPLKKLKFTDTHQEVLFVYRKSKSVTPLLVIAPPKKVRSVIPPNDHSTSQYGKILSIASGIFLFGSPRQKF